VCDERADDVMKQSRNLLCGWASILFGSVNLKLGCGTGGCGFWLNSTPLNREDNHALEHHVGIVYRIPAKKEHDRHRSNEIIKSTYNHANAWGNSVFSLVFLEGKNKICKFS